MKFGHDFKEALQREGFPERWVERAIPYNQLKKCIKKILRELEELGLDSNTVQELVSTDHGEGLEFQYKLEEDKEKHMLKPRLTIFVQIENGTPVDATLTNASKKVIQKLLDQQNGIAVLTDTRPDSPEYECGHRAIELSQGSSRSTTITEIDSQVIEIPLQFDAQFFKMLQKDVGGLEEIQEYEEQMLSNEIEKLQNVVATVSRPSKYSKTDLNRWREIFNIYLDAQVFFSQYEANTGARQSSDALKKLQWFQSEIQKRNIESQFKRLQSQQAFARFVQINSSILKNLQFQEINRLAITKILKKFDKRTSFGVSKVFPKAIDNTRIMSGSIAKDLCAAISTQIVSLVPQVDDYLCPICCSITWRAVRLACDHVFCIRCVIKMQKDPKKKRDCPLCRANTVLSANTDNLDRKLEKFLQQNFPKEIKQKAYEDDLEEGIAAYGANYHRNKCQIM